MKTLTIDSNLPILTRAVVNFLQRIKLVNPDRDININSNRGRHVRNELVARRWCTDICECEAASNILTVTTTPPPLVESDASQTIEREGAKEGKKHRSGSSNTSSNRANISESTDHGSDNYSIRQHRRHRRRSKTNTTARTLTQLLFDTPIAMCDNVASINDINATFKSDWWNFIYLDYGRDNASFERIVKNLAHLDRSVVVASIIDEEYDAVSRGTQTYLFINNTVHSVKFYAKFMLLLIDAYIEYGKALRPNDLIRHYRNETPIEGRAHILEQCDSRAFIDIFMGHDRGGGLFDASASGTNKIRLQTYRENCELCS